MPAPQPAPPLAYANPDVDSSPRADPLALRLVFFALSLVAAVTPFLTFAYDTSPLDVFLNPIGYQSDIDLLLVAVPFFAAVVAAGWKQRLVIGTRMGRVERWVAYGIAVAFAVPPLIVSVKGLLANDFSNNTAGLLLFLTAPPLIAAGAGLAVWHALRARHARAAMTALDTAYAANAAPLLIVFHGDTEIGYRLTLAAVVCIAIEVIITTLRSLRAGLRQS